MNFLLLFIAVVVPLVYLETRRKVGLKNTGAARLHSLSWFLLLTLMAWIFRAWQVSIVEICLWLGIAFAVMFAACWFFFEAAPIEQLDAESQSNKSNAGITLSRTSSLIIGSACYWLMFIVGKDRQLSLENPVFIQYSSIYILFFGLFCMQQMLISHLQKRRR